MDNHNSELIAPPPRIDTLEADRHKILAERRSHTDPRQEEHCTEEVHHMPEAELEDNLIENSGILHFDFEALRLHLP